VKKMGYKKVLAVVFCSGFKCHYILKVGSTEKPTLFSCPDNELSDFREDTIYDATNWR
jgi:hypothetical protein